MTIDQHGTRSSADFCHWHGLWWWVTCRGSRTPILSQNAYHMHRLMIT